MNKLFILLNIIPAFLTALGLFVYYVVIDGACSRYPDVYPILCPFLGHSAKKSGMTALKVGDKFPDGVNFRYAVHAASMAAFHC